MQSQSSFWVSVVGWIVFAVAALWGITQLLALAVL